MISVDFEFLQGKIRSPRGRAVFVRGDSACIVSYNPLEFPFSHQANELAQYTSLDTSRRKSLLRMPLPGDLTRYAGEDIDIIEMHALNLGSSKLYQRELDRFFTYCMNDCGYARRIPSVEHFFSDKDHFDAYLEQCAEVRKGPEAFLLRWPAQGMGLGRDGVRFFHAYFLALDENREEDALYNREVLRGIYRGDSKAVLSEEDHQSGQTK